MEATYLEGATRVGVADAKANLSGMLTEVERAGETYVIERYGRPVALLSPLPSRRPAAHRAQGALSEYADAALRDREKAAFAHAMEAKHGRPA